MWETIDCAVGVFNVYGGAPLTPSTMDVSRRLGEGVYLLILFLASSVQPRPEPELGSVPPMSAHASRMMAKR